MMGHSASLLPSTSGKQTPRACPPPVGGTQQGGRHISLAKTFRDRTLLSCVPFLPELLLVVSPTGHMVCPDLILSVSGEGGVSCIVSPDHRFFQ